MAGIPVSERRNLNLFCSTGIVHMHRPMLRIWFIVWAPLTSKDWTNALRGSRGWQTIAIFMCVCSVSRGLVWISVKRLNPDGLHLPPCEKNHTNEPLGYYISQRIRTGKLSEWLCLALEPDTSKFIFAIIVTVWASGSNTAWTDFIGLTGIRF